MPPNHWLVSEDKFKKILYIRSNYKHRPKNTNKEIDLVYLIIYFYSWRHF